MFNESELLNNLAGIKIHGTGAKKNNTTSTKLRSFGNQFYSQGCWILAMDFYNASLAVIGTDNVASVYANRSACFLHMKAFDKCLADIELATKANHPQHLMAKLAKRKADCLQLMAHEPQKVSTLWKLSYEPREDFAGLANVLEIQQNDEFGLHMVATSDLAVGEVVSVENTFLSCTYASPSLTWCETCQKTGMNFIPCEGCNVAFCNENCKAAGLHKYDCNFIYFDDDEMFNAQLKIMAHSIFIAIDAFESVEQLMKFVKDVEKEKQRPLPKSTNDPKSKYQMFLTFCEYQNDFQQKAAMPWVNLMYGLVLNIPAVKVKFNTPSKKRFLKHLFAIHATSMQQNTYNETPSGLQQMTYFNLISPIYNHSCAPNLFDFAVGSTHYFIVQRPTKAGEQLFSSYEYDSALSNQQRQAFLMGEYGFLCKCDKCQPRFDPAVVLKLVSDPKYRHLINNRGANLKDNALRMDIKQTCVDLLNEHGRTWSPALQFALFRFNLSLPKYRVF